MKKRISAVLLALIMIVTGIYVTKPVANEAWAADTKKISDEITPDTANTDMLAIKMQASEVYKNTADKDAVDLRIVTSVNGLGYSCVGLKVWYGNDITIDDDGNVTLATKPTATYNTESVIKRINAADYKYSPKVIDTSSEYFVTATIKGILTTNFDKNFYIQAYCKPLEGANDTSTVYGEGKLFNIADATQNINIAVPQGELTGTEIADVTVNGESATATLAGYYGGKAHLYVEVDGGKTSLPSASKIVVGGAESECYAIYRNLESDYTGNNADTSWYTVYEEEGETEFVIATDADLYGFANATTNFAGKTVYMVADIDANDGKGIATANEFTRSDSATPYTWTPIGANYTNAALNFAGTFDGQQHTISGLYNSLTGSYTGGYALFGTTGLCTIRDFNLANTYFELDSITNNVNLAGVAGVSDGIFDTIKVEEDVYLVHGNGTKEDYTGGIVGMMSGKTEGGSKISNCQFSGQIIASDYVGGILAYAVNSTDATEAASTHKKAVEIEHCLNNGSFVLNGTGNCIGGICGTVTFGQIEITDSVNTALINLSEYSVNSLTTGSFVGWIRNNYLNLATTTDGTENTYTAIIENSYGVSEGNWKSLGYRNSKGHSKINGTVYAGSGALKDTKVFLSVANLTGETGYVNTNLDFTIGDSYEGYWSTTTNGTPVLSSFADIDTALALDEVTTPRTAWYTDAVTSYTLYSFADMLGFASLTTVDFSSKTVELGADITMNKGTASATGFEPEVAETELVEWTPINVTGVFDGQGYTIRGLYLDTNVGNAGLFATVTGTVKDLRLLNSYIHCTDSEPADYTRTAYLKATGSIAGSLSGTIDSVYSDAFVNHQYAYAGGLVGTVYGQSNITNSCFAGEITARNAVGGLVGLVINADATIAHCLNAGKVATTNVLAGGLCGYVRSNDGTTHQLNMIDTLNVGKIASNTTWCGAGFGRIVGAAATSDLGVSTSQVTLTTTYWHYESSLGSWTTFANTNTYASVTMTDAAQGENSNTYHNRSTQQLLNQSDINLSFLPEGHESSATDDYYWVARTGKIPMLESFEDLLTNVTY